MHGSLKGDQYRAQFRALLAGEPLPYGNYKGKLFDKAAFDRVYTDCDPLLVENIPARYAKYFVDDFGDLDEVELGRSAAPGNYKLSPVKPSPKSPSGVKESRHELRNEPRHELRNESKEAGIEDLFEKDERAYLKDDSVLVGNPKRHAAVEEYAENGVADAALDKSVDAVLDSLRRARAEVRRLNEEAAGRAGEVERMKELCGEYRAKLRKYYNMNQELRGQVLTAQAQAQAAQAPPQAPQTPAEPVSAAPAAPSAPSTAHTDSTAPDQSIASIDEQIQRLQLEREKLVKDAEGRGRQTINVNLQCSPELLEQILRGQEKETEREGEEDRPVTANVANHADCILCHPPKPARVRPLKTGPDAESAW